MLYGWTEEQWALCYGQREDKPKTIRDVIDAKREYLKRHRGMAPHEELLIHNPEGDTRPRDWESASYILEIVMRIKTFE